MLCGMNWAGFRRATHFSRTIVHRIGTGDAVRFASVLVEEPLNESDVRARVKRATEVGQMRIFLSDERAGRRLSTTVVIAAKMLQQMLPTLIAPTADRATDSR